MNERIKQLAKEAGYYLYDLTETHECKTVETDSKDEWITLEKFAELIVNQCADIAQQHNKSPVAAPLAVAYVIREHFGVKE
jgi:hypothetical protein